MKCSSSNSGSACLFLYQTGLFERWNGSYRIRISRVLNDVPEAREFLRSHYVEIGLSASQSASIVKVSVLELGRNYVNQDCIHKIKKCSERMSRFSIRHLSQSNGVTR